MRVLVILEWDNPKEEGRLNKYIEWCNGPDREYMLKIQKGLCKVDDWSDGTGHNVDIQEFESMGDFAKVWGDDEYHRCFVRFCRTVDNVSRRTLRDAVAVPP
jgi:hypothetical protein